MASLSGQWGQYSVFPWSICTNNSQPESSEIFPSSPSLLNDRREHEVNFSVMKYKELPQFFICLEQGSAFFFSIQGQKVYILGLQAMSVSQIHNSAVSVRK